MKDNDVKKTVVVAGDVCIDWFIYNLSEKEPRDKGKKIANWRHYKNIQMFVLPGGALLLRDFVNAAMGLKIVSYPAKKLENISPEEIIHSTSEVEYHPYKSGSDDKVIRIKIFLGYSGPINGDPTGSPELHDNPSVADIVILDDAGNGFRDNEKAWPTAIQNSNKNPFVIYKMSWPLAHGKLWKKIIDKHVEHVILIIDANDLREEGINISRRLSWERTVLDFMMKFPVYKEYDSLSKCPNIIVRFGLEGAIHYYHEKEEKKARLFYIPDECEDENKEYFPGVMQGLTSAFVASLVKKIIKLGDISSVNEKIGKGIPAAIASSRSLLEKGYILKDSRLQYPYSEIFSDKETEFIKKIELPDVETSSINVNKWRILEYQTQMNTGFEIAKNYVINGTSKDLENVPVVKFGGLVTVDRNEIENFRSIKNLIKEYFGQKNSKRPLSLAVFGPPGSGKSFGVTQVAKTVKQERSEPLEYNVSQFELPQDLIQTFHEIRDYTLKGIVPLVFFDEFDSSYKNEPLGWLKYFLAPMQDGQFKDGEKMHPIGKAIFIFAGGTSRSFSEFSREVDRQEPFIELNSNESEMVKPVKDQTEKSVSKIKEKDILDFKQAKGPDFVSRLKGYVDIMGANPLNIDDKFFIIRRAVLLRSISMNQAINIVDENNKIHIDEDVLRAFLLIPEYKHGSRSISALVDMSMLSGRSRFEKAALPPPKQLDLHVDSEIFMKLLDRELFLKTAGENMARAAHEYYLIDQRKKENPKPDDHPSMQKWENLREDLKESNREQAYDIPGKLLRINCDYRPIDLEKRIQSNFDGFTEKEIEILAEMEHERWMQERFSKGWKYGEVRDDERRIHNCLVPWDELPNEIKGYDRDAVKAIPEILKIADFEIYRI